MHHLLIYLLLLLAMIPLRAAEAKEAKIAYLEHRDRHTRMAVLAQQLDRLGLKGTDISARFKDPAFKLSSFDVLLVGSFALNDPELRKSFRSRALQMRRFVSQGGAVLMFTQESDVWDMEPWFPPGVLLLRGSLHFSFLKYLDTTHPLFRVPNNLDLDRLNGDWRGDDSWPGRTLTWWTIRKAYPAHVLAALTQKGEYPWCVEMGWGQGRVIVFACAPDKVPEDQPDPARKLADEILQNALAYGVSVAQGAAHPLPEGVILSKEDLEKRPFARRYTSEEEKAFDLKVNRSVDQGVNYLKRMQKGNGSWGTFHGSNGSYESGLTALALLALLNAGINKYNETITRGFEFIDAHPPKRTYELGLTLMALEMRAAPLYERFDLAKMSPAKREKHRFQRDLSPSERIFMQDLTDRLVSYRTKGGCWCYDPEAGGSDISNGQFAVLGLKAAARCGIKIPRSLWEEVLDYYITFQQRSGAKTRIASFKAYDRTGAPKFYAVQAEPRGWGYNFGHPGDDLLGSHVNIGICCLILAYEELAKQRAAAGYNAKVKESVRDGLSWLASNWSIDINPGSSGKHYYYYYIYSLERVGMLTGRELIGEHHWYREGAWYLMEKQRSDGAWATQANEYGAEISNTGFALLFLKRSTPPPVITVGH